MVTSTSPSWSLNHESPGEDSVGFPAGADITCYGTQVDLYVFRNNMRQELSRMKDKNKAEMDRLNAMVDDNKAGHLHLLHIQDDMRNHFYSLQAYSVKMTAEFGAFKRKVMAIFKGMAWGGICLAAVVGGHFIFR